MNAVLVGVDVMRLRPWDESRLGGILFVLAHPDDETFLCGGTIARYAGAGVAVNLVCATRGESGAMDEEIRGGRAIAEVRTGELACAARVLGVDAVYFLGYRDSGMSGSAEAEHPQALANVGVEECAGRIARVIRMLRPRVVVTHGPYGEYGHPDHVRLHQATMLAFRVASGESALPAGEAAAWSPEALFVTTMNLRLVVRVLRLVGRDPRRFGRREDVDLVAIVERAPTATCVVGVGRWLAVRDRAFRCHRSQLAEHRFRLLLPRVVRRWLMGTEGFARVIPPWRAGEPVASDLFRAS